MLLTTNFEMTDRRRRRRLKVVPRATADFVRQLKRFDTYFADKRR